MTSTEQTAHPRLRGNHRLFLGRQGITVAKTSLAPLLRPAFLMVWTVWALATIIPFLLVWKQGTSFAWSDDWAMVPAITGSQPVNLGWLWAQHNEHRIAIPKLFFVTVVRLSHGDFRWEILGNIIVLSAVAALLLATLHRVRGRQSVMDAVVPLILLSTGQSAVYWGFEFQFVSGTALACALVASLLWQGTQFRGPAALLSCACLLCLPFVGGNGLLYVPILGLWIFIRGFLQLRGVSLPRSASSGAPFPTRLSRDRLYGLAGIVAAVGAVLVCGAYFIHYTEPASRPKAGLLPTIETLVRILSTSFGWRAADFQPYSGIVSVILVGGSLGWALWRVFTSRNDWTRRIRAIDLSAFMLAALMLIGAVAVSRTGIWQSNMNSHYSSLASPVLIGTYFILALLVPPFIRNYLQMGLFAVIAMLSFTYIRVFHAHSLNHRLETMALSRILHANTPAATLSDQAIDKFFYVDTPYAREHVASGLREFRNAGYSLYGAPEEAQAPTPKE